MPFPASDSLGRFEALLVKESVPDAVPDVWGAKFKVNGMFCVAAIVSGKTRPLKENCGFVRVAEEMVTVAPEALRVPGWEATFPTVTFPKLAEVGEIVSCPCEVPVPDCDTVSVGFEAFEVTVIVPATLPVV